MDIFEAYNSMPNQGKLLKTQTKLELSFVKSLHWFVIETHGSKLSMSLV